MTFMDHLFVFGAKDLFLLSGALALTWFWRLPGRQKKEAAVFAAVALPAIYAVSRVAAGLYFDPRPFVVGHFAPLVPHAPDNGFPSDHMLLVSAIASVIFPFSRRWSSAAWTVAILVGAARVYVGVHHPIDVIGSAVIAIIVSAPTYFVVDWYMRRRAMLAQKGP